MISRTFFQQSRIMSQMDSGEYLRYRLARRGTTLSLKVQDFDVTVRKGTPDLGVALLSLGTELAPLSRLFPADYDGLIIDGGGYIGTAALKLSRLYPGATIVTVEPSTRNLEILDRNVAGAPNIRVIRGALTAQGGGTITLRNRGTGEWGFTIVEKPSDRAASEMETVSTVSIADIAAMYPGKEIGILKLDIEGGEKGIFDDSPADLERIPAIFAELHERIAPGCRAGFERVCEGRWIIGSGGEKYLALKREG